MAHLGDHRPEHRRRDHDGGGRPSSPSGCSPGSSSQWAQQDTERQRLLDLADSRGVPLSDARAARAVAAGQGARLEERIKGSHLNRERSFLYLLVFVVGIGEPRRRDRRRPPDGAVLRRLDDRLGEHDRASCSSRFRSATGSAGGWPTTTRTCAASACWLGAPRVLLALVPFAARPFLDDLRRRARRDLGRRLRRLADRGARAGRGADHPAGRLLALGGAPRDSGRRAFRAGPRGGSTRSRPPDRWSGRCPPPSCSSRSSAPSAPSWSSRSRSRWSPPPALAGATSRVPAAVAGGDRDPGRHREGRDRRRRPGHLRERDRHPVRAGRRGGRRRRASSS